MKYAFLWRAFLETGDPLCYLFYKSLLECGRNKCEVWSLECGVHVESEK